MFCEFGYISAVATLTVVCYVLGFYFDLVPAQNSNFFSRPAVNSLQLR